MFDFANSTAKGSQPVGGIFFLRHLITLDIKSTILATGVNLPYILKLPLVLH